jgi:hypothetical protein
MRVNNLYIVEFSTFPHEADAVLIVDSNAVLPLSVAAQRFKVVSWRYSQIVQVHCVVQVLQFPQGHALNLRRKTPALARLVKPLCIRVLKVRYHQKLSLLRDSRFQTSR